MLPLVLSAPEAQLVPAVLQIAPQLIDDLHHIGVNPALCVAVVVGLNKIFCSHHATPNSRNTPPTTVQMSQMPMHSTRRTMASSMALTMSNRKY
ncbi:MAG: hypothetical protein UH229_02955 [Lachnospiraceae bacterium]|nr:hypothetical protein [Lachnospiraceae bacterium]